MTKANAQHIEKSESRDNDATHQAQSALCLRTSLETFTHGPTEMASNNSGHSCKRFESVGELAIGAREYAERHTRWDQARARSRAVFVGRGNAPGSRAVRRTTNSLTYICNRAGCRALVDRGAARREALRAKRVNFMPGDGCASQTCARARFRARRFAQRQLDMRMQVASGARIIVRWPETIADRSIVTSSL